MIIATLWKKRSTVRVVASITIVSSKSSVATTNNNIRKDDNDDGGGHESNDHTNKNYELESNKNKISNKSHNIIPIQITIPLNKTKYPNSNPYIYIYNNTME